MASLPTQGMRLVADIGGTNARLALYDPTLGTLRARCDYVNREYAALEDIIAQWLQALNEPAPTHCCLAVAAPPFDDRVSMLNINWSFSIQALAERFGFARLRCINDFQANAYSLPHLRNQDLVTLSPGRGGAINKLAAVGPGTGLGGSTLTLVAGFPVATACEPGHMGLAAATELEQALFSTLRPRYGEVHAEMLLSGPGLLRIYQSMSQLLDVKMQALTAQEISDNAVSGRCELCTAALTTFCDLLGSICGDFVLANGAYGGLYLTGGIVPNIIPFLQASAFTRRFQEKGNMLDHLAAVPIYVISHDAPGLIGAAHAPLQVD
jgi:glucokinase